MKRLTLILSLLLAGHAAAQTPPNPATGYDALLIHGAAQTRFIGDQAPASRAATVRRAITAEAALNDPTDVIEVAPGRFDFSASPLTLPACTLRGQGPQSTIFTSAWFDWDGTRRIAFQLANGTTLENLTLSQASPDLTVDGICCGFPAPALKATLRHVAIQGREWGLYCWQPACVCTAEKCTITAGRVCVASENSGNGQTFTLSHCHIFGDSSLSQCATSYDVSNLANGGVFGVVHRGGLMKLCGTTIVIKGAPAAGQPQLPRACAITDVGGNNSVPAGNTKFDLDNVRLSVSGAPTWYDIDLQFNYTQAGYSQWHCRGSESDGSLKRSW